MLALAGAWLYFTEGNLAVLGLAYFLYNKTKVWLGSGQGLGLGLAHPYPNPRPNPIQGAAAAACAAWRAAWCATAASGRRTAAAR